uniref:Ig-like domain-containing protein n=1 Tax=Eptatretus burgeri TaxID=7764 RepID=A0A8C4PYR3_EPTBU
MSGMNAILPCILHSKEGKPAYTAQWSQGEDIILSYRKNRKPIVNLSPKWKDKIQWRANITDGDATITLLNVIKEHNGEYICKLRENSMPKNDIKIMLQILPKEEPKDPKGDNIDDAQGQGWLTTTPMIYFGHSSKVENINPTVPTQESILQRPWLIAILVVLVLVILLLAVIVFVVLNTSKKKKQQDYRQEDVMEMEQTTASSVYEDML